MNSVTLVGRISAEPQARTLPSGDEIVTFRIVVDRPGVSTVDAIECVAWKADARRRVLRAEPGSWWEVSGSLRRRFWRAERGPVSAVAVEVRSARRAA